MMNHMRNTKSRPTGFTLIEVMLVLLIIGALAAAVSYNFIGAGERAKAKTTKIGLSTLKSALLDYSTEKGAYPLTSETLNVLVPDFVEARAIKDGWQRPFLYYSPTDDPSRPFDLFSMGADGQPNTPDDVSVWETK